MQGIIIAARYLAFRRKAKRTAIRDAMNALVLACPASFATALHRTNERAAAAFERQRIQAMADPAMSDRDYVLLLATFGPHIYPGSFSTLIPQLIRLLGPEFPLDTSMLTDANGLVLYLLRRVRADTRAEALLTNPLAIYPIEAALRGPSVSHARHFFWRLFRRTLREAVMVEGYVQSVLDFAGITAPAVDHVDEDDDLFATITRAPHATSTPAERAVCATTALTRLLPQLPHLVQTLAGKAALLGTDLPPSPLLLTGGSSDARLCVLRALAEATDAAFVAFDAGDLTQTLSPVGLFTKPLVLALPSDSRPVIGTIALIDRCDALFASDEIDYDWYRMRHREAQRLLAEYLSAGIPQTLSRMAWPHSPILFICGADDAASIHAWHNRRDSAAAGLRQQLHDRAELPPEPSLTLMVALLRASLRRDHNRPTVDATGALLAGFEVPEETLVAAARMAQLKRGSVAAARRVVEAAARRAVISRLDHDHSATDLIIAPDDLSTADVMS